MISISKISARQSSLLTVTAALTISVYFDPTYIKLIVTKMGFVYTLYVKVTGNQNKHSVQVLLQLLVADLSIFC